MSQAGLLASSGGCQQSEASLGLWPYHPISASVVTWPSLCVSVSSSYKDTSHIGFLGPTLL